MALTRFTWKLLTFFFLCFSIRAIGQGTVAAQFSVDLLAGQLNSVSRKSRLCTENSVEDRNGSA
jgi:hypothetical protein